MASMISRPLILFADKKVNMLGMIMEINFPENNIYRNSATNQRCSLLRNLSRQ